MCFYIFVAHLYFCNIGGILCSAAIYDATLISAYINGSVKLWDLASGSYGQNLKEKYSRDEDVVTSLCTCVAMNNDICVAGFQNGAYVLSLTVP